MTRKKHGEVRKIASTEITTVIADDETRRMLAEVEAGSPEVDRRRNAITDVLGAIVGSIGEEDARAWYVKHRGRPQRESTPDTYLVRAISANEQVLWVLATHATQSRAYIEISAYENNGSPFSKPWYCSGRGNAVPLERVVPLYESLPEMLGLVLLHFPELPKKLERLRAIGRGYLKTREK